MNAILASRDEIDPELEAEFLEAIVDAETDSVGDGDAAMRAINSALNAAISRGIGYVQEANTANTIADDVDGYGETEEDLV